MPKLIESALREIALDQRGFITQRQAVEVGAVPSQLPTMYGRGILERATRGVYRFRDVPRSDEDRLDRKSTRLNSSHG